MKVPVYADESGVKFDPDMMEHERLYHCIFRSKAVLVFKDSQDVLNCYEIEDPELVDRIGKCTDMSDLERLFDTYLAEMKLND